MNKGFLEKISVLIPLSVIVNYLSDLFVPLSLLFVAVVVDYITGIIKGWYCKSLSSAYGFRGIVKKLCYFILVCVGIITDVLISGYFPEYTMSFVAVTVSLWLIINDLISIVENLGQMGLPIPPVINKVINHLDITRGDKKQ